MDRESVREIIYDPPPDSKMVGTARALSSISDGIAIIHGRSCCHADSLLFGALTSYHDGIRVLGSGIRGQDISTGGDRKLSLAIRSAYREFNPRIIAVLTASVPTMMGDDVEGTVATLKKSVPVPIIAFPCAGYEGQSSQGYEEVLSRLTDFMTPSRVSGKKINLLGFKGDHPAAYADLKEIERILALQDIEVNSILASGSFEVITRAPEGALNVVICGDGKDCASSMEKRFGTPCVTVPYPYGYGQTLEFLTRIGNSLGKKLNHDAIAREKDRIKSDLHKTYAYLQGIYGLPVAVVGEGSRAFHLACFLRDEMGFDVKLLATTTKGHGGFERQIKGERLPLPVDPADLLVAPDHFRMGEAIRERKVEIIFGSTMEKKLARELGIPLVRTSYPALDAVYVSDFPYAGFRGVINLVQTVINAVIGQA